MGGLDLDGVDLVFLEQKEFVWTGLIAAYLIVFRHRLAAWLIDILPLHRIAGLPIEDTEADLFAFRRRAGQFDGAGYEGKLEVASPCGARSHQASLFLSLIFP